MKTLQLAFDFPEVEAVGHIEEAEDLWNAFQDRRGGVASGTPEGWTFLGAGGTRVAYRAPSGVCYKVCHEYDDDESHNEVEHKNMRRIRREGKLPKNWSVPRTWLHVFEGKQPVWDAHMRVKKNKTKRIVILACDYIEGEPVGWRSGESDRMKLTSAFTACGLSDTGGENAIKGEDGTYYVIDAAEIMAPEHA